MHPGFTGKYSWEDSHKAKLRSRRPVISGPIGLQVFNRRASLSCEVTIESAATQHLQIKGQVADQCRRSRSASPHVVPKNGCRGCRIHKIDEMSTQDWHGISWNQTPGVCRQTQSAVGLFPPFNAGFQCGSINLRLIFMHKFVVALSQGDRV